MTSCPYALDSENPPEAGTCSFCVRFGNLPGVGARYCSAPNPEVNPVKTKTLFPFEVTEVWVSPGNSTGGVKHTIVAAAAITEIVARTSSDLVQVRDMNTGETRIIKNKWGPTGTITPAD